jgi:hypothetical protein
MYGCKRARSVSRRGNTLAPPGGSEKARRCLACLCGGMESRRAKPKSKQAFTRRAVRNAFIKFVTNEPKVTTRDNLQSARLTSARTRHVCVGASNASLIYKSNRSGNC